VRRNEETMMWKGWKERWGKNTKVRKGIKNDVGEILIEWTKIGMGRKVGERKGGKIWKE
jgi:hypothetical protein